MRKNGILELLITLAAGVWGYNLRTKELTTVFDEVTGLAQKGAWVTIALIALSAAICVLLIVLSLLNKNKISMRFSDAFGHKTPFPCFILCLAGAALIVFGVQWLVVTDMSLQTMLWGAFATLSGVSVIVMAINAYRGKGSGQLAVSSMIPVIFLCIWLILSYIDRAADPVLLNYVYEFFAIAFATMGFYYISGFAFGKMRLRSMLVCSRIAVFFIMVHLADDISFSQKAIYVSLALTLIVQSWLMTRNGYLYKASVVQEDPVEEDEDDGSGTYDDEPQENENPGEPEGYTKYFN